MIEDRLRAAMTAHDAEAPDGSRLVVPTAMRPTGRRREIAAGITVTALMLVVIGTFGYRSSQSAHSPSKPLAKLSSAASRPPASRTPSALHCPARPKTFGPEPWVPAKPQGVDGTARLTPLQTPAHAVVCAYIGPHSPAGKSGSIELTGDLAGIPTDLAWVPPVSGTDTGCSANLLATDGDYYLVGLSYPAGELWVSAPADHCEGSGNGTFASPAHLAGRVAQWYQAGRWVAGSPSRPCGLSTGRLGQQTRLVPSGATSITICDGDGHQLGRSHPIADADRLIQALNGLSSGPSQPMCIPISANFWEYQLFFHYAEGPPVRVSVLPTCKPGVDNGSLQAQDATGIVPLVAALIAAR